MDLDCESQYSKSTFRRKLSVPRSVYQLLLPDWLDWFIIRPGINGLLLIQGINGICDRGLARVSVLKCSELLFRNVERFSTRTFHPETLFSKSTTIMAAYHLAISLIPIPAL